jgi:hypothetical protein
MLYRELKPAYCKNRAEYTHILRGKSSEFVQWNLAVRRETITL